MSEADEVILLGQKCSCPVLVVERLKVAGGSSEILGTVSWSPEMQIRYRDRVSDQKTIDQKTTDQKTTDQNPTDQNPTDQNQND